MKAWLFGCLTCLVATLARTESFPAFYNVVGVSQKDVLNIRAAPDTNARILATLSHDATAIEVITSNAGSNWGQINIGEQAGWVSLDFLTRQPGQADDELPRPLSCFGTEPFWDLEISQTGPAKIAQIDSEPVMVDTLDPVTSANQRDRYAVFGEGNEQVFTFIFHRDTCSDQMTDRSFGMSVDIFMTEKSGVSYVTGCCTLSH